MTRPAIDTAYLLAQLRATSEADTAGVFERLLKPGTLVTG